jgi:tRNA(Ile2) C34 agmatinyltransferase TiaS
MTKKCPRCHSSMLAGMTTIEEGSRRVWRCLGCAREILVDSAESELESRGLPTATRELSPAGRKHR